MSYGKYEDFEKRCKLQNNVVEILEKEHPERVTVIHFESKNYADDYFENTLGGKIAKIIKTWSYYIKYFKVQIGEEIFFYCVHKDKNFEYQVYEVKNIESKWEDVCELKINDPIYKLIMEEFKKQEEEEEEIRRINRRDNTIIIEPDPREELERIMNKKAEEMWWGKDDDEDDDRSW